MTTTPWGSAEELRARKLSPGPSRSREVVARNQRNRLLGATVAAVAEQGYEATRVADIIGLAGVSRSAFYGLFANKQECLLATVDEIAQGTGDVAAHAYRSHEGPWDERLGAVLEAIVELILSQPAAARLGFVEVYAAGPDAVERIELIGDEFVRIAADAVEESPERSGISPSLIRGIMGGLRQIIRTRLRHERQVELTPLTPDLLAWSLGYRTPPEPLHRPQAPPELPPSAPDANEQRERILAAVADIVVEKGYQAMTITEIAQQASVSLSTLYAHFEGKPDVFLAAIDNGERRVRETVAPAYRAAPDWPHAVKDGLHACFAFLATNTAIARLAGLDVFSGGAHALDRHETSVTGFQELLQPGCRDHPSVSAITAEAAAGSISALLYDQLRLEGATRLYEIAPVATFVALAPFVGNERACAIANEDWTPRVA